MSYAQLWLLSIKIIMSFCRAVVNSVRMLYQAFGVNCGSRLRWSSFLRLLLHTEFVRKRNSTVEAKTSGKRFYRIGHCLTARNDNFLIKTAMRALTKMLKYHKEILFVRFCYIFVCIFLKVTNRFSKKKNLL